MSEWIDQDEFFDSAASVEDLLRRAADEVPSIRRGLKAETMTLAQRTQREIRLQHFFWGAVTAVMLFTGGLIWWPASDSSAVASNEDPSPKPVLATPNIATDAVDWELVESKNQLRRRNLQILRNAF